MSEELLTEDEHRAVGMAADLWNLLCEITSDGPARSRDLEELCFHIHGIQRAVLKQAAARAYPDLYRLLGGHPAGTAESIAQITAPPPLRPDPDLIDNIEGNRKLRDADRTAAQAYLDGLDSNPETQ